LQIVHALARVVVEFNDMYACTDCHRNQIDCHRNQIEWSRESEREWEREKSTAQLGMTGYSMKLRWAWAKNERESEKNYHDININSIVGVNVRLLSSQRDPLIFNQNETKLKWAQVMIFIHIFLQNRHGIIRDEIRKYVNKFEKTRWKKKEKCWKQDKRKIKILKWITIQWIEWKITNEKMSPESSLTHVHSLNQQLAVRAFDVAMAVDLCGSMGYHNEKNLHWTNCKTRERESQWSRFWNAQWVKCDERKLKEQCEWITIKTVCRIHGDSARRRSQPLWANWKPPDCNNSEKSEKNQTGS
jgi:hypothetical protein